MTRLVAAWSAWRAAIFLGFATIGSYGVATYSIGVLIAPIEADTGWSTGTLSGAYGAGVLASGGVALLAGRTLDRTGSRPVFLGALVAGTALLLAAASMRDPLAFAVAWALGSAAVGGGLYYQATMPATARLYPARRAAAFSVLTLLGALASPIFYPLAGVLIEAFGWRDALRLLVGVMVLCVLPAAVSVHSPPGLGGADVARRAAGVREALARPAVWRAMLAIALSSAATSALILHQVPAMQAAGLTLAAASGYGGARGFMQIPARLLLTPLTRAFGVRGSMVLCYAVGIASAAALLAALAMGSAALFAVLFAATSGFSVGLLSPLNGLFAVEVYGEERLGTLSGVQQVAASVAGAASPWAVGLAVDITQGYRIPLAGIVGLQVLALAALAWQRRARGEDAALPPPRAARL